ncbi:MAG: glycosyltransferase family 9 protein [Ghiorsea sp.]
MNILIVRNDKLGDFITALPSCFIIKQHLPGTHLSVLVSPINASIAMHCPFIDQVIIDQGKSVYELAKQLKNKNIDISITLFSNTRVAIAQFLARIPKRFAPATKIAQVFYNQRISQRRSQVKMAEFEYNIQLAQAAFPNIDTTFPSPLLTYEQKESDTCFQDFCQQLDIQNQVIAFHPGFGGSSDANWHVAEYIKLAKPIENNAQVDIVFTFGPGDEAFYDEFNRLKGNLNCKAYFSKGSVLDFALLISHFKLFISTSTGTFHLASAVGTPTMTFFADTLFASAKRWKGIGDADLQHNYMIPQDVTLRTAMFNQVKKDLQKLI